jgi:hypothetical protein
MSRIKVTIDRLVLSGMEAGDRRALAEGLKSELARLLSDPASRAGWAGSRRIPLLRLGRMPLEPGRSGAAKCGSVLARSIGSRLKP